MTRQHIELVARAGLPRRVFLGRLAAAASATALAGCVSSPELDPRSPDHDNPDPWPFPDGVIAGDPRDDGAVIWTRVELDGRAERPVTWLVASDADFDSIVAGGVVVASDSSDGTVHVDVSGLPADGWFRYRFECDGSVSRTGRLRTAPAVGDGMSRLRFCFASCQQLNDSWFVAHTAAAAEPEVDFFLHLGDYVYANDETSLTLADYRGLYRRWRREPLLREWHAAQPLVVTWDDGEFYNGVNSSGPPERVAAARQAFVEHMPLAVTDDGPIYRSVVWGDLARLHVLDGRRYRDATLDSIDRTGATGWEAWEASRQVLGVEQTAWLFDGLAAEPRPGWHLVGNGTPIGAWKLLSTEFLRPFVSDMPPDSGFALPAETWDDFAAQRRAFMDRIAEASAAPVVMATAHTHFANANELRRSGERVPIAYDFVAPSMTADPDVKRTILSPLPTGVARRALRIAERWLMTQNPQWRYINLEEQGYVVVDVDADRIDVSFRMVDTFDPQAAPWTAAAFRVARSGGPLTRRPAERPTGTIR